MLKSLEQNGINKYFFLLSNCSTQATETLPISKATVPVCGKARKNGSPLDSSLKTASYVQDE